MDAILKTSNLSIGYRKGKQITTIMSSLTLSLNRGELVSVLGENGAGKSTLIRTLTGLQPAIDGEVILNGKSTLEEMISSTEKGIYAKYMGGGSVNPATGNFNFAVMEGYLIENGKITSPVRGATLIGTGSEVLKKIDMVGNNLAYGQGMCGSVSGSLCTNVGQPAVRVSEITVGGRK